MNANGTTVPNRGEKILQVILNNGEACSLRMQITDVHRALRSVSRVCDSGHSATSRKGGTIKHTESDGEFHFGRVNGVYRMEVELANPSSGFSRPA